MMEIVFGEDIPFYGKTNAGYGFIGGEETFPRRRVSTEGLFLKDGAVCVAEQDGERFAAYHPAGTDFDLGGMLLRIALPQGVYEFSVECEGGREAALVSISGMNPVQILQGGFWDAGELVPVRYPARWEGDTWRYTYVNAGPYVDISLEPLRPQAVVGIRRIIIREREQVREAAGSGNENGGRHSVYILGDSTAKSYVFEEAPMSGWGQLFHRVVDPEKGDVVNYSNGGRSLRGMYQEGRLNDLLLRGRPGDFLLLQSGHNDERARNDGIDPDGEGARFGRGSTEEMYEAMLKERFLPAIRTVGMIPVLVTPVTRINAGCGEGTVFVNSFRTRDFPAVMRKVAAETGTLLLDLNQKSVEHFNQVGAFAAKAMVMSLEPGETPGKTNGGSYANGNPGNHADGTHYKECLSRQYCRMAVEELARTAGEGNGAALNLSRLLKREALQAAKTGDFSEVFPEVCRDTVSGRGAHYRDQIEKMVQLSVFRKDTGGNFHPLAPCSREEFREGIRMLWQLPENFAEDKGNGVLLKMDAAGILYDAYAVRFGMGEERKPPYMTDYNGRNIDLTDPNYDVNLDSDETMYYPLTPYGQVADLEGIRPELRRKVEAVYRLGLMRCEGGIRRGRLENGVLFVPDRVVTRETASKYLYFCFVLGQNIKKEDHRIDMPAKI